MCTYLGSPYHFAEGEIVARRELDKNLPSHIRLMACPEHNHLGWTLSPRGEVLTFTQRGDSLYATVELRNLNPQGALKLLGPRALEESNLRHNCLCMTWKDFDWILDNSYDEWDGDVRDVVEVPNPMVEPQQVVLKQASHNFPDDTSTATLRDVSHNPNNRKRARVNSGEKDIAGGELGRYDRGAARVRAEGAATWNNLVHSWKGKEREVVPISALETVDNGHNECTDYDHDDITDEEIDQLASDDPYDQEVAKTGQMSVEIFKDENDDSLCTGTNTVDTVSKDANLVSSRSMLLEGFPKENLYAPQSNGGPSEVAAASQDTMTPHVEVEPRHSAYNGNVYVRASNKCTFPGCKFKSGSAKNPEAILSIHKRRMHTAIDERTLFICTGTGNCKRFFKEEGTLKRHKTMDNCAGGYVEIPVHDFLRKYPERRKQVEARLNKGKKEKEELRHSGL